MCSVNVCTYIICFSYLQDLFLVVVVLHMGIRPCMHGWKKEESHNVYKFILILYNNFILTIPIFIPTAWYVYIMILLMVQDISILYHMNVWSINLQYKLHAFRLAIILYGDTTSLVIVLQCNYTYI